MRWTTALRRFAPGLAAACSSVLLVAALAGRMLGLIDITVLVALQVVCAGGVFVIAYVCRGEREIFGASVMLGVWILIGGALGVAVWAAIAFPKGRTRPALKANEASVESDRAEALQNALIDNRLRIEGAHMTRPLRDVFIGGEQAEKFQALAVIARRYSAGLGPALRMALNDRDPGVRVLASSVMVTLESRYLKCIRREMMLAAEAPNDLSRAVALFEAYVEYADSGLLRAERRREALNNAQAALTSAAGETSQSTLKDKTRFATIQAGA